MNGSLLFIWSSFTRTARPLPTYSKSAAALRCLFMGILNHDKGHSNPLLGLQV
jgi:hypothetical protein